MNNDTERKATDKYDCINVCIVKKISSKMSALIALTFLLNWYNEGANISSGCFNQPYRQRDFL